MRRAPRATSLLLLLAACGAPDPLAGVPLGDLRDVDPDIVRAVEEARNEVARQPDSSRAWGGLADRYLVHQFMAEAAECYGRAEELDPGEYQWSYRRGWALLMDRPDLALGAFERALRSLDDYAPAHDAYAQTLFRLGDLAKAERHFARARELDADFVPAATGQGQVALARGDFESARTHLEEALRLDPKYTEAHLALAQVYTALGLQEEALEHADLSRTLPQASKRLDRIASPILSPAGARDRSNFARSLEKAKQFEEAIENYRIAVESNPHYYVARKRLALLLNRRGNKEEALALLEAGLELTPSSPEILADIERVRE